MDYAKLDDATLIRLVAHHREEALSELYDRYNRLVFSLALHVLGDRATAEEVTLDVFTRIWEKAESYDAGQAKVSTWLSSIARNRSIDLLRRRNARPEGHSVGLAELSHLGTPTDQRARALQPSWRFSGNGCNWRWPISRPSKRRCWCWPTLPASLRARCRRGWVCPLVPSKRAFGWR